MWAYVSTLIKWIFVLIFIDYFSRKSWIYFLKTKNETFSKFQEFKALIENQTGKHIRILRSDNGGEFESHNFEDFCKEVGIKRQLIVPYNPQQNGVVERKNKTICEVAKVMMCDQDLPTSLWTKSTRIEVLMLLWEIRLQKKCLQVKNQKWDT
jgi:transposase InsO family protein